MDKLYADMNARERRRLMKRVMRRTLTVMPDDAEVMVAVAATGSKPGEAETLFVHSGHPLATVAWLRYLADWLEADAVRRN